MRAVGLRELKNRLSVYVRLVRAGESIQVTDRGQVVAELKPPEQANARPDLTPELLDMARRGLIRLSKRPNHPSLYRNLPRVRLHGITTAELLDQERGER